MELAEKAIQYDRVPAQADAFLYDLNTSVSLIIKDGNINSFIHRSFQEYFVAYFLAFREFDQWDDFVFDVIKNHPNDSVIALVMQLNSDRFERHFFIAPL